ncbi:MAG: chorismate synthase [Acidobacteria bacterium]|nr:chorismate synthase [Acidobacteriota bacterium]
MRIEKDAVEITSGVRDGLTMGSPISFLIQNKDWKQWEIPMSSTAIPGNASKHSVTRPRPGHADMAGVLKFQLHDIRNVLERASARETAARVAVGAFCRQLLGQFAIQIGSHVLEIGGERVSKKFESASGEDLFRINPNSQLRCLDRAAEKRMQARIDRATREGDTVGGVIEVVGTSIPVGLGSCSQWDRKLDGLIAQAMMSIHAVKAVEIGSGIESARKSGSAAHDEIFYDGGKRRFFRKTNRAGGLEGGITNGSDLRVRIFLKPVPTLRNPLASIDIVSKAGAEAAYERSDTCIVPAAAVISEAMLAIALTGPFLEKFGGDSLRETKQNFASYQKLLDEY